MKILRSEQVLDRISTALDSVLGLDGKTLVPSKQYLQYLLVKIIGMCLCICKGVVVIVSLYFNCV